MVNPEDVARHSAHRKEIGGRAPTERQVARRLPVPHAARSDPRSANRIDKDQHNDTIVAPAGSTAPAPLFDNRSTNSSPVFELLTMPEAARLLTVSVPTMRRLQQQRVVPFIKVGRSVRFEKRDLVSYLKRRRVDLIG